MTYHYFCHFLLVRIDLLNLAHTQQRTLHKNKVTGKDHLSAWLPHDPKTQIIFTNSSSNAISHAIIDMKKYKIEIKKKMWWKECTKTDPQSPRYQSRVVKGIKSYICFSHGEQKQKKMMNFHILLYTKKIKPYILTSRQDVLP